MKKEQFINREYEQEFILVEHLSELEKLECHFIELYYLPQFNSNLVNLTDVGFDASSRGLLK